MSLINQMLRDLEKRRKAGGTQPPIGEGEAVFAATGGHHRGLYFAIGGIVLIGVVWGGVTLLQQHLMVPPQLPSKLSLKEPVAVTRPATMAPSATATKETVGVSAERVTETVPTNSEILPPAVDNRLELLRVAVLEDVGSARLLLEFKRLPEYRWSLRGDDHNQLKISLLETVGSANLPQSVAPGDILRQLSLETEADGVSLNVAMKAGTSFDVLELPADEFFGDRLVVEFSAPLENPPQPPVVQSVEPKRPLVEAVAVPAAKPSPDVQPKPSAVKKLTKKPLPLTPEEKATRAYQAGLKELRGNNIQAAEKHFTAALQLQPEMLDARLQLVTLLQHQQKTAEAARVLEQGLQLMPANRSLRKVYARQLMSAGQPEQAVGVLLSSPAPMIAEDLEYHALVAALHQENGQHIEAIETYQGLLQRRPQASLWWLGLAISLDQSGDTERAREAYRKALSASGLRADLREYAHSRLQDL